MLSKPQHSSEVRIAWLGGGAGLEQWDEGLTLQRVSTPIKVSARLLPGFGSLFHPVSDGSLVFFAVSDDFVINLLNPVQTGKGWGLKNRHLVAQNLIREIPRLGRQEGGTAPSLQKKLPYVCLGGSP